MMLQKPREAAEIRKTWKKITTPGRRNRTQDFKEPQEQQKWYNLDENCYRRMPKSSARYANKHSKTKKYVKTRGKMPPEVRKKAPEGAKIRKNSKKSVNFDAQEGTKRSKNT